MKIEEQNQHISTFPVATEASYSYYESRGIFGKRNISLISVYYPLVVISENHLFWNLWKQYNFLPLQLEK